MPYVNVSVDIDMSEIDTDELIDELACRGYKSFKDDSLLEPRGNMTLDVIEQIYQLRRTGQDYQQELDRLIYLTLDRLA